MRYRFGAWWLSVLRWGDVVVGVTLLPWGDVLFGGGRVTGVVLLGCCLGCCGGTPPFKLR